MEEKSRVLLETIDLLRERKVRPNLINITHFALKRLQLKSDEVNRQLEDLIKRELIYKTEFKGKISYRRVLGSFKTAVKLEPPSEPVEEKLAKVEVKVKVEEETNNNDNLEKTGKKFSPKVRLGLSEALVKAVKHLLESGSGHLKGSPEGGVSEAAIRAYLVERKDPGKYFGPKTLRKALDREVSHGIRICQLENGNYHLLNRNLLARKKGGPQTAQKIQAKEEAEECSEDPLKDVPKKGGAAKRGRPISKRKRFKKFHGPDFVDPSFALSSEYYYEEEEEEEGLLLPLCDLCQSPNNPGGEREELLSCTDCPTQAHPTCMEYSPELAAKSRLHPWQCMNCKICTVCKNAEDGELMLFCDSCDKGFHLSCHTPKIIEKPTGKWVCFLCQKTRKTSKAKIPVKGKPNGRSIPGQSPRQADTAGLPTPCDSPVSDYFEDSLGSHLSSSSLEESYPNSVPDAKDWAIDDVTKFFQTIGFSEQAVVFKEQEIDGPSLLLLKRADVLTGMSLRLGPALKIYQHIQRLQTRGGRK